MTPDADLPKLPLELLYREMVNRYLALSPSKGEYAAFWDVVASMEKALAADKPKLRERYIELCRCMTISNADKVPADFCLWDTDA